MNELSQYCPYCQVDFDPLISWPLGFFFFFFFSFVGLGWLGSKLYGVKLGVGL